MKNKTKKILSLKEYIRRWKKLKNEKRISM